MLYIVTDMLGFVFFAALSVLGECMVRKGSPDKGEALLSESLSIKRTAFPIDNSTIATSKCHDCIVAEDNVHL